VMFHMALNVPHHQHFAMIAKSVSQARTWKKEKAPVSRGFWQEKNV
jgi:hypothetical protein